MSQSYAPPSGPPPLPRRSSTDNLDIPDEAPPAYTPHAAQAGSTTVDAGPSRMDFSGPPPMPERLTNNITGVGMGYGPRIQGVSPQPTGSSGMASNNPFGDSHQPQLGRTDSSASFNAPSGPPPPPNNHSSHGNYGGNGGNAAGSASGHADLSPTEVPTPGRPLLRNGQMLVYPKGHHCPKCGNTGYKANDPSNPHDADWRKYGKPFTAALAASYKSISGPNANPAAASASNFQRPLPAIHHAPQHHQPPPGQWHSYPGHNTRPPPPTQQQMPMYHNPQHYGPPPPHTLIQGSSWNMPPPGALVLQAGDPRIGGRLCHNCGGHGREISFFGFDDGKCWTCRGLGRIF